MLHPGTFPRERVGKVLHKAGLSETTYGYLLRTPRAETVRGRAYEAMMAAGGTVVAIGVVALLLVPALRTLDGASIAHVALSMSLLSLAGLLLRNACMGNLFDAEIDFDRLEIRVVRRSTRGRTGIEARVPFDEVRSLFVHRSKRKAAVSTLCMRVSEGEEVYELMAGSEEAMSTLHRRLVRDVNTVLTAQSALALAADSQARSVAQVARVGRVGVFAS